MIDKLLQQKRHFCCWWETSLFTYLLITYHNITYLFYIHVMTKCMHWPALASWTALMMAPLDTDLFLERISSNSRSLIFDDDDDSLLTTRNKFHLSKRIIDLSCKHYTIGRNQFNILQLYNNQRLNICLINACRSRIVPQISTIVQLTHTIIHTENEQSCHLILQVQCQFYKCNIKIGK